MPFPAWLQLDGDGNFREKTGEEKETAHARIAVFLTTFDQFKKGWEKTHSYDNESGKRLLLENINRCYVSHRM